MPYFGGCRISEVPYFGGYSVLFILESHWGEWFCAVSRRLSYLGFTCIHKLIGYAIIDPSALACIQKLTSFNRLYKLVILYKNESFSLVRLCASKNIIEISILDCSI